MHTSYPRIMNTGEPIGLHTDRLLLREVDSSDLEAVHRVFDSNPDFLQFREMMESYDLDSVTRYWEAASFDSARHVLLVVRKDTGIAIGLLDFIDQSPTDGKPWVGLIMIHDEHQRHGFGTEAVRAVTDLVGSRGHRSVRMAVITGNEKGSAFARHVGFEAYGQAGAREEGAHEVALMELSIDPRDAG